MTKRHLGIARIVFFDVQSAQNCINKYNGKSVMGKVLNVFHDAFGEHCKRFLMEANDDPTKKSTKPVLSQQLPVQQQQTQQQQMLPTPNIIPKDEYPNEMNYHQIDSYNAYARNIHPTHPHASTDVKSKLFSNSFV